MLYVTNRVSAIFSTLYSLYPSFTLIPPRFPHQRRWDFILFGMWTNISSLQRWIVWYGMVYEHARNTCTPIAPTSTSIVPFPKSSLWFIHPKITGSTVSVCRWIYCRMPGFLSDANSTLFFAVGRAPDPKMVLVDRYTHFNMCRWQLCLFHEHDPTNVCALDSTVDVILLDVSYHLWFYFSFFNVATCMANGRYRDVVPSLPLSGKVVEAH